MSLNYVGIKGGLVLFVADDPGPISSQTEQDTRRFAAFAKIPVLDPQNLEQGYAMMQEAFEISERYHTPVIVRPTTRVCHASTYLEVPEHTVAHPAAAFEKDPKWVIFPRRSFTAHGEVNERLPQIADAYSSGKAADAFNPIENHGDATPRLVSYPAPRKRRGASSTADTSPRKRRRGARPSQRSCAPFSSVSGRRLSSSRALRGRAPRRQHGASLARYRRHHQPVRSRWTSATDTEPRRARARR